MTFIKEKYRPRIIDKSLKEYLETFGAVSIEGPKWCGKTWTGSNAAKSIKNLDMEETRDLASLSPDVLLDDERPELIDEWNLVPKLWDVVRRKCDETTSKGNYILTCSTKLNDEEEKSKVIHSGAGRIGKLKMYPLSLYESGESNGYASLTDMYNGTQKDRLIKKTVDVCKLARIIVRGGWPGNLETKNSTLIPKNYIESILDKDMNDGKNRDREKMLFLLKSLARNESTVATNTKLLDDIDETKSLIDSRITLDDYLDVLNRLHLIINQPAYSANYRSRDRIGKNPKRHLVDPSLVCSLLDLTPEKLMTDLKTYGFVFESLVERDLRIYIESLGGNIYHFRDSVTGLEVDTILEFPGGDYAAIEIKLGSEKIPEAKESLLKFANLTTKKPKFMCVIVADYMAVVKDPETDIYVLPITSLRP